MGAALGPGGKGRVLKGVRGLADQCSHPKWRRSVVPWPSYCLHGAPPALSSRPPGGSSEQTPVSAASPWSTQEARPVQGLREAPWADGEEAWPSPQGPPEN